MKRTRTTIRDRESYYGALLEFRDFIEKTAIPPQPMSVAMRRVFEWFRALPPAEQVKILSADPDEARKT